MNDCEMPKYKCHKEVWALKIKSILFDRDEAKREGRESDGSALIVPVDDRYESIRVSHEYVRKHNPEPGGYFVVYEDRYQSFSPAEAFEAGYTLIES